MTRPTSIVAVLLLLLPLCIPTVRAQERATPAAKQAPPNIVIIISDDVGYGDVGCYGATKVKTPNIDRFASQGLRFTDAYATSATCTPSRYSLMTGQYAWRKKGTGILPGNAPLAIDVKSMTVPRMLQQNGYATACVGKWHLGLGIGNVDWNGTIAPGPIEVGFDYCFIIPATGDRVPCVFIENHKVVGFDPSDPIAVSYGIKVGNEPTGRDHPELLKVKPSHGHADTIVNGISRIGFMSGGHSALWKDDQIADTLTKQAVTFIEQNKERPFFLYFATHDIHVPRVPAQRFRSTSECGIRGDAIQELDWSVGQVMETLDRLKLADNTLVIFTSDNGPVVDDGYADGSVEHLNGHTPAGPLRGGKYTIWEGGTRMPFITRWHGRIKPGVSHAMVCQVDFLASFAGLVGKTIPASAGPDSFDVSNALLGQSSEARPDLIEHNGAAQLALREGNWKLVVPGPRARPQARPQLFNLADDLAEAHNVAKENPDVAKRLAQKLAELREAGHSRPGFQS